MPALNVGHHTLRTIIPLLPCSPFLSPSHSIPLPPSLSDSLPLPPSVFLSPIPLCSFCYSLHSFPLSSFSLFLSVPLFISFPLTPSLSLSLPFPPSLSLSVPLCSSLLPSPLPPSRSLTVPHSTPSLSLPLYPSPLHISVTLPVSVILFISVTLTISISSSLVLVTPCSHHQGRGSVLQSISVGISARNVCGRSRQLH